MRERLSVMLVLAALLGVAAATAAQTTPASQTIKELPAVVATLSGPSEALNRGATVWVPTRLRAEVDAGIRTTAIGRAALRTVGGHAIRIGSLTEIALSDGEGDQPLRVKLEAGRLWVAVSPKAAARPGIEVTAGPVVVRVRGGGVSFRTERDGGVLVRAYHGAASCSGSEGAGWRRDLKGGEELVVPAGGRPGEPRRLTRDDNETLWVKWNEEQDSSGYGGPPSK